MPWRQLQYPSRIDAECQFRNVASLKLCVGYSHQLSWSETPSLEIITDYKTWARSPESRSFSLLPETYEFFTSWLLMNVSPGDNALIQMKLKLILWNNIYKRKSTENVNWKRLNIEIIQCTFTEGFQLLDTKSNLF